MTSEQTNHPNRSRKINAIADAQAQLDAWNTDDDEQSTINDVFHAVYERWPDDCEQAVDLIYAARDKLTEDEARGVLRILWPDWPGFRSAIA